MAKRSKFQIRSNAAKKRWHVRDPDKEVYWRGHIDGWRNSGLSKYAYCIGNDLSYSSFLAWIREIELRDREKAPPASAAMSPPAASDRSTNPFVPIRVVQNKAPGQAETVEVAGEKVSTERRIEIELPGGAVIRLHDGCNASFVANLLSALKE